MKKPPVEPRPRKRRPNRTSGHRTTTTYWSEAEYEQVRADARAAGLGVAAYIRARVYAAWRKEDGCIDEDAPPMEKGDLPAIQEVRTTQKKNRKADHGGSAKARRTED